MPVRGWEPQWHITQNPGETPPPRFGLVFISTRQFCVAAAPGGIEPGQRATRPADSRAIASSRPSGHTQQGETGAEITHRHQVSVLRPRLWSLTSLLEILIDDFTQRQQKPMPRQRVKMLKPIADARCAVVLLGFLRIPRALGSAPNTSWGSKGLALSAPCNGEDRNRREGFTRIQATYDGFPGGVAGLRAQKGFRGW